MLKLIVALAKRNKLSQIHPIEKIFFAVVPIVIMGFVKNPIVIFINIVVLMVAHLYAENSIKVVSKFTIGILFFTSFSSLTFVLDYGVKYCLVLILKGVSSGLCLSFFSLTTPLDDVFYLLSKNKMLRDLCDIAKSMERFIILIEDEGKILYYAILSRGGFESFSLKIRNTGKMAGLLFINTMKRWEDIRNGIHSRCYTGSMPYFPKEFSFSYIRFFFVILYLCLLSYGAGIL